MIITSLEMFKISKKNTDVLIIDECGSEWIEYCIPQSCECAIVKIRGVIPYVNSLSFLFALFKNLIIFRDGFQNFKSSIRKIFLASIIDELNPAVLITFIDNNSLLGSLFRLYPEVKMISVQNGMRVDNSITIGIATDDYIFDDYYTFGLFEKDLYTSKGMTILSHHPKGSLKLGIYLSKYGNSILSRNKNSKTICFVSQYRKNTVDSKNVFDCKFVEATKRLYELTVLWALNNNFNIVVSMVCSTSDVDYNNELIFFKEIVNNNIIEYSSNDRVKMISYENAISSSVVIGMDSTLLLEMFGIGKKVLWGSSYDSNFLKLRGMVKYNEKMPPEVMLYNLDDNIFNKKVDSLLSMSQHDYISTTADAKEYFMNINEPYPHEVIKNNIQNRVY